jgi:hypothetical protein
VLSNKLKHIALEKGAMKNKADELTKPDLKSSTKAVVAGQIGAPLGAYVRRQGVGAPLPPVRIYIGASSPAIQAQKSVLTL